MSSHPGSAPVSKPYDFQPYPAVRYRRGADGALETCRVLSADDDAALGPEWCASPADVASEPAPTGVFTSKPADEPPGTAPASRRTGKSAPEAK